MRNESRYINRKHNGGSKGVRLLVITPVQPTDGNEGPFPISAFDRRLLLPTTQVDEILCAGAPEMIFGADNVQSVTPLIVEKGIWAESNGYDAILINCMVDPGAIETQRQVNIPVIGLGRAATALATVFGDHPARIYPDGIAVNNLADDEEMTINLLTDIAKWQIHSRGADVITFNCGYLGGAAQRLQDKLGAPVIPTIDAGLRLAEMIAHLNIRPKKDYFEATRLLKYRRALIEIRALLIALIRCLRGLLR